MRWYYSAVLFAFAIWNGVAEAVDEPPVVGDQIAVALERSFPFLELEGRKWIDGKTKVQKAEQRCVSCHQVPAGIWSLFASASARQVPLPEDLVQFATDAVDNVSQAGQANGASWGQLLSAISTSQDPRIEPLKAKANGWRDSILEKQRPDGRWESAGQFPSQRRPTDESDAVVTMWMLHGLDASGITDSDPQITAARQRAAQFLNSIQGVSIEWRAWTVLLGDGLSRPDQSGQLESLLAAQHRDGGWPFVSGGPSDAYATGVTLYVLSSLESPDARVVAARDAAVRFLLQSQQENGTWLAESAWYTQEPSANGDYVYQYWGTAWATLGLAASVPDRTRP